MAVSSPSKSALFIRWRWIVYASMFMGWSFYYLCRKSLASSMPSIIQENGFSMDDIGFIASSHALAYGLSKFFSAILSDYISAKGMFSLGLGLSGFCCLLFPLTKSVLLCTAIWFVEGIVQGLGWAPCAKLLRTWYPPSQMGTWWSILSGAGNIAAGVSPVFFTYLSSVSSWRVSYYLVGSATSFLGLLVLITIKNSPTELGIHTGFDSAKPDSEKKKNPPSSWYDVFFLKDLWVASAVYAILYLLKNGVVDWTQLYFIQHAKKPVTVAAACLSVLQIGGLLGNLIAGYISDLFVTPHTEQTKCPRAPVLFGVSIGLTLSLHLLASTVNEESTELWLSTLLFTVGLLYDSGIAVIGLVCMDIVPSKLSGSAHGLACAIAQVGSIAAGWPFAFVIENYSWTTAYFMLELANGGMVLLCSYLLLLLLRGLRENRQTEKVE